MMASDNNPRIRGILPPIQPLARPLPLYKPRFISQEFLRGAKAMADVQHLLFLGSAAARGTAALIVATGSNVFDGLPSRGAGYSSIVHRGEQETKGYLLKLLGQLRMPPPLQLQLEAWFVGPLIEEIFYRGIAQYLAMQYILRLCEPTRRRKKSPRPSSARAAALGSRIVGSGLFGLAHIPVGVSSQFAIQKACGTFCSSLLIESRLANNRRNVWAAVGAHAAYNAIADLSFNLLGTGPVLTDYPSILTPLLANCAIVRPFGWERLGLQGLACAYVAAFWLLFWKLHRWFLRRFSRLLGQLIEAGEKES